jgi:hypothetical protein
MRTTCGSRRALGRGLMAGAVALGMSGSMAMAGTDVMIGVGLGVSDDFADAASRGNTKLSAGPQVMIPLRVAPLPWLRIRADLRFEMGFGVDELSWSASVDGVDLRRTDTDAHRAFVGSLGAEVGFEVMVPVAGAVRPYLGVGVGVAGVGSYHALDESTAVLLDPDQNSLGDTGNVDPYTLQAALSYSLAAGVNGRVSDTVDLWGEIGYGAAFLPSEILRRTPVDLDARREAFAWNPFRLTVGVLFKL